MDGYLLDTNTVAFWFNEKRQEHASVLAKVDAVEENAPFYVSVITVGEIEYGHRVESAETTGIQAEYLDSIEGKLPQNLPVSKHTAARYGDIRARLFNKYAPKEKRSKGMRPEQLIDPVTASALHIQENDIWIAAQAIERNLVLVTHDNMRPLREIAPELRIEDWAS